MKIAVYGREFQNQVIQYVQELFDLMAEEAIEVWVYLPFREFLVDKIDYPQSIHAFQSNSDLPPDIKFMLSLGGDGTMLAAVSIIADSTIPVTGINFGRLGFLASIGKDNIKDAFRELLLGNYDIERRVLLSSYTSSEAHKNKKDLCFALNDITLVKKDSSAMMTVHAYVNDELLNSYWSDGLIIATPTGSTAYSLSCGGPIVMPGSGNFIITPISPHNLNVRPIVVSDSSIIRLEVESRSDEFLFSCDSDTRPVKTNIYIHIRKADFAVNLIRLKNESFFRTLRQKLLWGLDTRNY
ncbi:NAD kinase [Olivibacter sp. SDN3]|uniref:NAD kinase n=1 Tax=Olivibacter sp. SDN3 TaxID=2764720 RepID=UPI001651506F|nr:NAD kinase [Olivibacter sp. SDN3]QNL50003.1 NAD kinase [Olivibacter sp. SDN3]